MDKRPRVRCFAACVYGKGDVWDEVRIVSLEVANLLRTTGWQIIGPDPHDLFELAKWEKEQGLNQ